MITGEEQFAFSDSVSLGNLRIDDSPVLVSDRTAVADPQAPDERSDQGNLHEITALSRRAGVDRFYANAFARLEGTDGLAVDGFALDFVAAMVDRYAMDRRRGTALVAGATGYLGWYLTSKLRTEGWTVIAVARNESEREASERLQSTGARVVYRDASHGDSWSDLLSGCDAVLSCMASPNRGVGASEDFWSIDRDANARLGAQSAAAGVRHFVLFATFEGPHSRRVTAFSEAKEAAVDAIRSSAASSGMVFTVIRANAYFKDLTSHFFDSVLRTGSFHVYAGGTARINPIHGADVADFAYEILIDQTAAGVEYPVGGPDVFTFREIGLLAADVIRPQGGVRIVDTSLVPLMATSALLGPLAAASRGIRSKRALVRWMIYALTHDAVARAVGKRRLVDDYRDG